MRPLYFLYIATIVGLSSYSCSDDDGRTCTTCSSEQTEAFELCEEPNGNASVNGENTNTDYDTYLNDLLQVGVSCGG